MLGAINTAWLTGATVVVAGYYATLVCVSLAVRWQDRRRIGGLGTPPLAPRLAFVLVVPARNEELVISDSLRRLQRLTYPERVVLVMDDGSTDATGAIVRSFAEDLDIYLLERTEPFAGVGKGAVLNHAFERIVATRSTAHPVFGGRDPSEVIIGIMDADGHLDPDALERIAPHFGDPAVAAVQIGVRINNAGDNIVSRMQDIEFVGFSGLVQTARNAFGSVGLGGNGQFTRLSALIELGRDPWSDCLSEDLDLSLSLVEAGHEIRFCGDTFVAQQGLTHVRPLLRQRARWVQGHYQCWRHIIPLLRSPRVRWRTKLDLSVYLTMISFLVVMTVGVALSALSLFGVVDVTNDFWNWVPPGPWRNSVLLLLSCGPASAFVLTYQRRSPTPLRLIELPAFAAAFCVFGYHWLIAQLWAFARMSGGRRTWAKTPREAGLA